MTSSRRLARVLPASALVLVLGFSGSGAKAGDSAASASAAPSCVETDGETVKIGFLNSLSGTMAISEQTVRDSLDLAAKKTNAAGVVLGKELEIVAEACASERTAAAGSTPTTRSAPR